MTTWVGGDAHGEDMVDKCTVPLVPNEVNEEVCQFRDTPKPVRDQTGMGER